MKIVYTRNKMTLRTELANELEDESLTIEKLSPHAYEFKEHVWSWFWRTIARIDTHSRTIRIIEKDWTEHKETVKRLASVIERQDSKVNPVTIEVRP